MKLLKRAKAFVFIFFIWFLFSSPYFLFGKVPYASTYQVNFFPPWASYERFHGPVKNNAMPDVHGQIFPWKKFTIDTYRLGQIPLWNPNNFGGNPHLANFQSAVLSPFNILFFVLPFIDAWSILILLQPLLAGLFMYLMLRSFKLSSIGSLVGATSFMFCGFLVTWMAYGTLGYAILYLPLSIFAIQKFINTKKKKYLLLLTLTIPLSIFSGHFQISIYFLLTTILFAIFKRSFSSLVSILFGLLLGLPQVLPSYELYKESVRSSIFIITEAIPFKYLSTIFAPDFFGNPVTRNDWFGHYAEWSSFVGIIPLSLAFFSLLQKRGDTVFFWLLGIFSLVLSLNSPFAIVLVHLKIPVISTSSFSRIIVLTSFSIAALAAFGFDNLSKLLGKGDYRKIYKIILFVTIILMLLLITSIQIPSDKINIAIKSLRIPLSLLAGFVGLILLNSRIKKPNHILLLILMLSSVQSFLFASKWMPFDPKNLVYPNLPIIEEMKKNVGYGRVFGNLGAEVSSYYGIPIIDGYDPLYIQRYGEFVWSANQGFFESAQRSVVKAPRRGEQVSRVLDIMGVSLIFHPIADTNMGWAFPVWEDPNRFTKIYQDNKFALYKNNTALPRAMVFYKFEIQKNKELEIARFYKSNFNFRDTLLLEENPNMQKSSGTGSATITYYSPDVIKIDVNSTAPGLLFLSDNFYPGWEARVNGKTSKIYRADYTFRAVSIPKGKSEVEFVLKKLL